MKAGRNKQTYVVYPFFKKSFYELDNICMHHCNTVMSQSLSHEGKADIYRRIIKQTKHFIVQGDKQ